MDTTQRQVMKAQHPEEQETQIGWYLVGAVPLIVGGVFFLAVSAHIIGKFAGARLAFIGLTIVAAALWVRASEAG